MQIKAVHRRRKEKKKQRGDGGRRADADILYAMQLQSLRGWGVRGSEAPKEAGRAAFLLVANWVGSQPVGEPGDW